jgi:hypothetical protein
MQKCCLSEKAKNTHIHAPEAYISATYRVGRLVGGRPICLWCLLHLQDLVRPAFTESDVYHQKELIKRFPELWDLVQEIGIDVVRRELTMQWIECEPSQLPTRPEQMSNYPPTYKVTVEGTKGGLYGG